ncbi:hypothetical protein [Streptomyces venezuelae]|uniref:hypothetical protein n=1 Tax=Streptomyces venezuelae TaxID=54571 RepID=UPI00332F6AB2
MVNSPSTRARVRKAAPAREARRCAVLVVPSLLAVPASPPRTFAASLEDVTVARLRSCLTAGG